MPGSSNVAERMPAPAPFHEWIWKFWTNHRCHQGNGPAASKQQFITSQANNHSLHRKQLRPWKGELIKERNVAKSLHGCKSPECKRQMIEFAKWQRTNQSKVDPNQTENWLAAEGKTPRKSRQEAIETTWNIHRDFSKNKLVCKSLKVKPVISRKISCSVSGGNVIETLHLLPTEDDAKTKLPQYAPKSKVIEGVLEYEPHEATELSNKQKKSNYQRDWPRICYTKHSLVIDTIL